MNIRILAVGVAGIIAGLTMAASPALATEVPAPIKWSDCDNLKNWDTPADETAPTPTEDGLFFGPATNVYHAIRLDLADVTAPTIEVAQHEGPESIVIKLLTGGTDNPADGPFTTINVTAEGKYWATAMDYDQVGGQGHPVAKASDLVGKDTKAGKDKLTNSTKVTRFGLGFGNGGQGSNALVSELKWRGVKYSFTCKPVVKPTPSTSTSSTPKPTKTSASPSKSSSAPAAVHTGSNGGSDTAGGASLPVTGAPVSWVAGGAAVVILTGIACLIFGAKVRRARVSFKP